MCALASMRIGACDESSVTVPGPCHGERELRREVGDRRVVELLPGRHDVRDVDVAAAVQRARRDRRAVGRARRASPSGRRAAGRAP